MTTIVQHPSWVTANPANNRILGYSYDANGNGLFGNATEYDVENHVSGGGWSNGAPVVDYGYDAQSRRFLVLTAGTVDSYGNANNYLVAEYSPSGQKLGTYQINTCNDSSTNQPVLTVCSTLSTSDQYFGGRRLAVMDQLGSAGTYYPWGEAKGSTNPQDTWSFATYWRDSATGLDYANNRYYSNAYGRFMTPDPYTNSGRLTDPQSWNRYAYTRGDPVNRFDPLGTDDTPSGGCPENTTCMTVIGTSPLDVLYIPSGSGGASGSGWGSSGYFAGIIAATTASLINTVNQLVWNQTLGLLSTAAQYIGTEDDWFDTTSCQNAISSLGANGGPTLSQIESAAINVNFQNPYNTTYLVVTPPSITSPSVEIPAAWYFEDNPGLFADVNLGTNVVFWAPGTIYSGATANQIDGAVLHELFHTLGYSDQQIAAATGVTLTPGANGQPTDTVLLGDALQKLCFPD